MNRPFDPLLMATLCHTKYRSVAWQTVTTHARPGARITVRPCFIWREHTHEPSMERQPTGALTVEIELDDTISVGNEILRKRRVRVRRGWTVATLERVLRNMDRYACAMIEASERKRARLAHQVSQASQIMSESTGETP